MIRHRIVPLPQVSVVTVGILYQPQKESRPFAITLINCSHSSLSIPVSLYINWSVSLKGDACLCRATLSRESDGPDSLPSGFPFEFFSLLI